MLAKMTALFSSLSTKSAVKNPVVFCYNPAQFCFQDFMNE